MWHTIIADNVWMCESLNVGLIYLSFRLTKRIILCTLDLFYISIVYFSRITILQFSFPLSFGIIRRDSLDRARCSCSSTNYYSFRKWPVIEEGLPSCFVLMRWFICCIHFLHLHILQICEYQNKTEFFWMLMILSAIGSSFHTIHTMNISS